jgi:alkylhydroperoxidase family enzyme
MTPETDGRPAAGAPAIPLPKDDELPEQVRNALANLPALNIFRMLGRLPESFRPFLQLGGSLLGDPNIDARIREIAILRVARATGAGYEWAQHEQLGQSVGVTDADIEAVRSDDPAASLDAEAALVCRVADEISNEVRLSDEALALLLERYEIEQACSIILCVSYYNMVSRFLESTRVEIEAESPLAGRTANEFAQGTRRTTK